VLLIGTDTPSHIGHHLALSLLRCLNRLGGVTDLLNDEEYGQWLGNRSNFSA
jgi:hypothetical protein